jgi:tubulin-specific chaperone C
MHTSRDVDVYLSIQSNPIIEHCAGIRFGSYPRSVLPDVTQNVLSVQDFSHIKPAPSPNWRFLSDEEKLDVKEGWYERLSSDEDISPILDELLPNVTAK